MRQKGPMPIVEYEGKIYSLRSRKTIVPDLKSMERFSVLLWLCRNTTARGYSKPNPLVGLAGVIEIK